jgi:hypothetical protein
MNTNSELFKRAYLSLVLAEDNTLLPNISYKNFIHFPYIKDGESNVSYYSAIFVDIKENENKYLFLPQDDIIIEYRKLSTHVITNTPYYSENDVKQIINDFFKSLDTKYLQFLEGKLPSIKDRELTYGDFSLSLDKMEDFYIIKKSSQDFRKDIDTALDYRNSFNEINEKASDLISPYITFRYKLDEDPMPSVDVNYRYSVDGVYPFFVPVFDLLSQESGEIVLDKSDFNDIWRFYSKKYNRTSLYQDVFGEDAVDYFSYAFIFDNLDDSINSLLNTKDDENLRHFITFSKEKVYQIVNKMNLLCGNEWINKLKTEAKSLDNLFGAEQERRFLANALAFFRAAKSFNDAKIQLLNEKIAKSEAQYEQDNLACEQCNKNET